MLNLIVAAHFLFKPKNLEVNMHGYIENVRRDIEQSAGEASYLTSSLFVRIHNELNYEDEGKYEINSKDEFEIIRNKALNAISKKDSWKLGEEVLSWKTAILRDISQDFYSKWDDYIENKFLNPTVFADGTSCTTLEASCEILMIDPTEYYTIILEINHLLTRVYICCNNIIKETSDYWMFRNRVLGKEQDNEFSKRRVDKESKNTILQQAIEKLRRISNMCLTLGKKSAGSHLVLWMNAHLEIKTMIIAFLGVLNCSYTENSELMLNKWIEEIFPSYLESGEQNPIQYSALHNLILRKLTLATNCLVEYVVKKQEPFLQRDNMLREHFRKSFDKVLVEELEDRVYKNKLSLALSS